MVSIRDCNDPASPKDWSDRMSLCFYAKFFGMCWNKSFATTTIYDMKEDSFSKVEYLKKKQTKGVCDSLDHTSSQDGNKIQVRNKRKHNDYYCENSGLFVLFQVIGTQVVKVCDRYDEEGLTVEVIEQNKKLLQSCVLTTIMKIINLFNTKPDYVYEPNLNDCDDNVTIWRECRKQVENKKVELKDIWVPFKVKSDLIRSKLPRGVGNTVDLDMLQPDQFYGGKPDYDYMKLFQGLSEKPRPIAKENAKLIAKRRGGDKEPMRDALIKLVMDCFKVNEKKLNTRLKETKNSKMKELKDNVMHCLMHFSTFILVDHENIQEYIEGEKVVEEFEEEKNAKSRKRIVHPVDIFAIMIVEKTVEYEENFYSLIHYLCVKRGYEGLGYAKKLLVFSMKDQGLTDKDFYMVSKLPQPYQVNQVKPFHMTDVAYKQYVRSKSKTCFYKHHKVGEIFKGYDMVDVVFDGAVLLKGDSKRFARLPLENVTFSSAIYTVDNNSKFSILCTEEEVFYSRNAFFGWIETDIDLLLYYNVPKTKIELAKKYRMKEVILYEAGAKQATLGEKECKDLTTGLTLPFKYHQKTYGQDLHGCVWLSACQVLYNINREQSTLLLDYYMKNPHDYQFLTIFQAKKSTSKSLDKMMKKVQGCNFRVVHVKPGAGVDMTKYILEERTAGIFVAVLEDTFGGRQHCVGLNKATMELYDPMESVVMAINKESLDIACGPNRSFKRLRVVGELDEYRFNKSRNNSKKRKRDKMN